MWRHSLDDINVFATRAEALRAASLAVLRMISPEYSCRHRVTVRVYKAVQ